MFYSIAIFFHFLVLLASGRTAIASWDSFDDVDLLPRQNSHNITCLDGLNFLLSPAPAAAIPQRGQSIPHALEEMAKISLGNFSQRLGQDFILGKKLGHGSFAHVYLTHQVAEDQILPMALKITHSLLADHQAFLREEFNLLRKLRHPNIAQVYHFQNEPLPSFLMEYVPGATLEEIFEQMKKGQAVIAPELLEKWQQQLIDSVDYLASKNVAHFDIKPENVIIDSAGNARLIDFNISITNPQRVQTVYQEEIRDVKSMFERRNFCLPW